MEDQYRTLTFESSDEDLTFAIEQLRTLQPKTLYPEAWRVLTTEQKRRQEKGRPMPMPIDLSATVFESLPAQVKARLRRCQK